jgi:trimeric autotransporter adhesin
MPSSERKLSLIAVLAALSLLLVAPACTGFFVNPTLSSLAIGPQSQTITVLPLQTLQMSATGTYSDGSTKDLTGKVIWSSATPSCATISGAGLVTPVAAVAGICSTTISAADGTITAATTTVTVSEGAPTQIVLTATPTTNPAPATAVTFKALATFPNSNVPQDITTSVTWINSDTTNLTLTNGSTTGTVSASAPTGTLINVTASFDSVQSNTVTLTVQ